MADQSEEVKKLREEVKGLEKKLDSECRHYDKKINHLTLDQNTVCEAVVATSREQQRQRGRSNLTVFCQGEFKTTLEEAFKEFREKAKEAKKAREEKEKKDKKSQGDNAGDAETTEMSDVTVEPADKTKNIFWTKLV